MQRDREELDALGITHVLDGDARAALIVRGDEAEPAPVYTNPAFESVHTLKSALGSAHADALEFRQWVSRASQGSRITQLGHEWTATTIAGRWTAVCGKVCQPTSPSNLAKRRRPLKQGSLQDGNAHGSTSSSPAMDYTVPGSIPDPSPHIRLFWATDWAATGMGAMSTWSPEVKHDVNRLMSDPRPIVKYWGDSYIVMYNEAYSPLMGKRHPECMGATVKHTWGEETAAEVEPAFDHVRQTGKASVFRNRLWLLERNGFTEECYFSYFFIPIIGPEGLLGISTPVEETTREHFAERQMSTYLALAQCLSVSQNVRDFWKQCLKGLELNQHDVAFAALYSLSGPEAQPLATALHNEESSTTSETSSSAGGKVWALEGVLGLDGSDLPDRVDSDEMKEQLTPSFRHAIRAGQHTLLTQASGTFPKCLVGKAPSRAFGEQCTSAFLVPIGPSTRDKILGFLLIGSNPRRAFDDNYDHFIQLLCRQLATSMASVVLIEDEQRRNSLAAKLAAEDRIQFSSQLAVASAQVEESESRFRRMADLAPVSLFHLNGDGSVQYANELWFQLTGHSRHDFSPFSWYDIIHEEDKGAVDQAWLSVSQGGPLHLEVRFRRPFETNEIVNGERVKGDTWVLADAYATRGEDGTITGILGCLTDVSRHKWAESFQERRKDEALEMKRVQENFIDMTSHEMRNPLAAIILCGDSISAALGTAASQPGSDYVRLSREDLENQIDAASTIALCAQHQKRIIDDVLTLSKLDAGLLLIAPVEVRPAEAIAQSLKIFDGQLIKSDTVMRYVIDSSYKQLQVDWVFLDPSRMLQVLINLVTNAIKFTQTEKTRQIVVSLKASVDCPSSQDNGVHYVPSRNPTKEVPTKADAEDTIYILVTVKDTGRGLTLHERDLLFQRFSQASAKTHVEYGGSGLGLFISRQLTELQGGEIGVDSEAGVGSTFAFYCRAARCEAPGKKATPSTASVLAAIAPAMEVVAETDNDAAIGSSERRPSAASVQEEVGIKNVLIVEDNLVNQKVMAKQLRQAGFIISVANHGVDGLEKVRKSSAWTANAASTNVQPLDVVLCDVEMPVMGGLDFAREVRKLEQAGEIAGRLPIIAVTANAREQQQDDARDAGMDSVVTKPFRMHELLVALDGVRVVRDGNGEK